MCLPDFIYRLYTLLTGGNIRERDKERERRSKSEQELKGMRNGISCDIAHGCGCLLLAGIIFTLHQQQQLMRSAAVALVS